MLIDVSLQATGIDYREAGVPVHLPPTVMEVRYNPAGSTRAQVEQGDRRKLARLLRNAGYVVLWDDANPAVALGGRSSAHKAQTARDIGTRFGGRKPSRVMLCPEPLRTALLNLDKGTLADVIFIALEGDQTRAAGILAATRQAREDEEVPA